MSSAYEQSIPWPWEGGSVGVFGFDMECDGIKEYIWKMYKKTKIDQILEFYGIPHIYKNEWKKYLKYRIKPEHCKYVNEYFKPLLRSEWYDISDWDYSLEQEDYNRRVPYAEQTWLDIKINYEEFLENDKKHRESITNTNSDLMNKQMLEMQSLMQSMMAEMKELKSMAWIPNKFLNSNHKTDDESRNTGWSDSTTNANWEEVALQEDGEDGKINGSISWWWIKEWWDSSIEWIDRWIE